MRWFVPNTSSATYRELQALSAFRRFVPQEAPLEVSGRAWGREFLSVEVTPRFLQLVAREIYNGTPVYDSEGQPAVFWVSGHALSIGLAQVELF
ncbi:MAG: hypothetical protein Q7V14_02275 [Coriobacteriia bacterium]|nr:hypothetical protein [Coriobacteriia bacterium]